MHLFVYLFICQLASNAIGAHCCRKAWIGVSTGVTANEVEYNRTVSLFDRHERGSFGWLMEEEQGWTVRANG